MGDLVPKNDISEEDYNAIQEAVMETARGRWFLNEYAKRNRVSDTNKVLDAIDNVKTYITREHEPGDVMQMRLNIVDMTQKIEQIKSEIANTDQSGPNIADAQGELNVALDETEKATSTILSSAEQIQGLAWEIRERGELDAECDKIDEYATEIYMACSFQDLTGQRLRKVVQLTEMLEIRLNAMVNLWDDGQLERYREEPEILDEDASLTNGPAMPDKAQGQDLIDNLMEETQGISVNKEGYDEIQWGDEPEDSDNAVPFIIEDDLDFGQALDTTDMEAASEVEGTAQVMPALEDAADDDSAAEAADELEAVEAAEQAAIAEELQAPEVMELEADPEMIGASDDINNDDLAAFEADTSEETFEEEAVKAESTAELEAESAPENDVADAPDTPVSQDSTLEEMDPLEERVATFN